MKTRNFNLVLPAAQLRERVMLEIWSSKDPGVVRLVRNPGWPRGEYRVRSNRDDRLLHTYKGARSQTAALTYFQTDF